MKILISCNNLSWLGGGEIYNYELAKELSKRHTVTIVSHSNVDWEFPLVKELLNNNVRIFNFNEAPIEDFDYIIMNQHTQKQPIKCLDKYKSGFVVTIIHSELDAVKSKNVVLPKPYCDRISKYITIRPKICDMLKENYNLSDDQVCMWYNGFDFSRFNTDYVKKQNEKEIGLYVGPVQQQIRNQSFRHLVDNCDVDNQEIWVVSGISFPAANNVKWLPMKWDVEKYIKQCNFTAGIWLGRTTIEGLLCGVPGYVYDVDMEGNVLDVDLVYPDDYDLDDFNIVNLAKKYERLYEDNYDN